MKKFLVFIERNPSCSGHSIPDHRNFIQDLREKEQLVSVGGFSDQTGGNDAVQLINQDPMYVENECSYNTKEWNVQ